MALVVSLFIGQMFTVLGVVLIASQGAAATIVKVAFFGTIVPFPVVPLIPRVSTRSRHGITRGRWPTRNARPLQERFDRAVRKLFEMRRRPAARA